MVDGGRFRNGILPLCTTTGLAALGRAGFSGMSSHFAMLAVTYHLSMMACQRNHGLE
jgi:hypothetical protein